MPNTYELTIKDTSGVKVADREKAPQKLGKVP